GKYNRKCSVSDGDKGHARSSLLTEEVAFTELCDRSKEEMAAVSRISLLCYCRYPVVPVLFVAGEYIDIGRTLDTRNDARGRILPKGPATIGVGDFRVLGDRANPE